MFNGTPLMKDDGVKPNATSASSRRGPCPNSHTKAVAQSMMSVTVTTGIVFAGFSSESGIMPILSRNGTAQAP